MKIKKIEPDLPVNLAGRIFRIPLRASMNFFVLERFK